jgi:hypothetical protein
MHKDFQVRKYNLVCYFCNHVIYFAICAFILVQVMSAVDRLVFQAANGTGLATMDSLVLWHQLICQLSEAWSHQVWIYEKFQQTCNSPYVMKIVSQIKQL